MSALLTVAGVKVAKRVTAILLPVLVVFALLGVTMFTMIMSNLGGSVGSAGADCNPVTGGSDPAAARGLRVTYFGDSVSLRVEPALKNSVASLTLYSQVGRQAPEVFSEMKAHQAEASKSDVVIIGTGNNGTVDEAKFRDALAGYKGTKLVLIINPYVKAGWEKQAQEVIKKVAASTGGNTKLVDWSATASSQVANYFDAGENVHPNQAGAQALAGLLLGAMGAASGGPSGSTASFKIMPSQAYRGASTPEQNAVTVDAAALRNVAAVAAEAKKIWPDDKARRDKATLIAVITMATEAGLHNPASKAVPGSEKYPNDGVAAGDHDSIGIFQQRAGMGYGTVEQIMNPAFAARSFFGIQQPGVEQWGLQQWEARKGGDWFNLTPGEVAAAIQRPASSTVYRYGLWVRDAPKVIQAASGEIPTLEATNPGCQGDPNGPYRPVPGQVGTGSDTYLPWWAQFGGYPGADRANWADPNAFYWGECVSYAAFMVKTTTQYTDFNNNWKARWGGRQALVPSCSPGRGPGGLVSRSRFDRCGYKRDLGACCLCHWRES